MRLDDLIARLQELAKTVPPEYQVVFRLCNGLDHQDIVINDVDNYGDGVVLS